VNSKPAGGVSPLRGLDNVIITPHIGGATYETSDRGVAMLTTQIERLIAGSALEHVHNAADLSQSTQHAVLP